LEDVADKSDKIIWRGDKFSSQLALEKMGGLRWGTSGRVHAGIKTTPIS